MLFSIIPFYPASLPAGFLIFILLAVYFVFHTFTQYKQLFMCCYFAGQHTFSSEIRLRFDIHPFLTSIQALVPNRWKWKVFTFLARWKSEWTQEAVNHKVRVCSTLILIFVCIYFCRDFCAGLLTTDASAGLAVFQCPDWAACHLWWRIVRSTILLQG